MEKSVCPPRRSRSWSACLAFLFAIFTQNALAAAPSDLVSPDGRFRVELHSEEASPEYLEIHDSSDGRIIRVNKIHFPLLGALQEARVLWSGGSRYFVLSDLSAHGLMGYVMAFDKNLSNVAVTKLTANVAKGNEIRAFSFDEKNRIVLEIHSPQKGNFQSVLEVMDTGAVRR